MSDELPQLPELPEITTELAEWKPSVFDRLLDLACTAATIAIPVVLAVKL